MRDKPPNLFGSKELHRFHHDRCGDRQAIGDTFRSDIAAVIGENSTKGTTGCDLNKREKNRDGIASGRSFDQLSVGF